MMTSPADNRPPIRAATLQDLGRVLANRSWEWRHRPFPHVVAQQVFIPAVYKRLTAGFRAIVDGRENTSYNAKHDFVGAARTDPVHRWRSGCLPVAWMA